MTQKALARKKTIHKKAVIEADRREIPAKKIEAFMKKKVEIDDRMNTQIDDLMADFRSNIAVFIGGHLKPAPKKLEEMLTECTNQMKGILESTAGLFTGAHAAAFKVIIQEFLVKGIDIVRASSVEVNELLDEMEEVQKQ